MLESRFLVDDSETIQAPKTPNLSEEVAKRQMNQVTSTDVSLYKHEDSPVSYSFQQDELDALEA